MLSESAQVAAKRAFAIGFIGRFSLSCCLRSMNDRGGKLSTLMSAETISRKFAYRRALAPGFRSSILGSPENLDGFQQTRLGGGAIWVGLESRVQGNSRFRMIFAPLSKVARGLLIRNTSAERNGLPTKFRQTLDQRRAS